MAAESQNPNECAIDNYGLRLAPKSLTGQRPHDIQPIPFLSQQISSTAELSYSDINRDVEVAFAMDDFTGGCASNLRFNLERQKQFRYAKNADTSYPGVLLPAPAVVTIGSTIADQPTGPALQRSTGIYYFAAGTKLYQVGTSSSTPTLDSTMAQAITSIYEWGGNLIIGQGSSANFFYRTGDTASSPTSGAGAFTDGGVAGHFFASMNNVIYRSVNPNQMSNAQGIAGPWLDYDVGDTSFDITSLGFLDQFIIVGKEDGPYGFDTDVLAQPIAPELRLQADAQVCKAAISYNRDYYVTSRLGAVRLRSGEGLKNVGLDLLADPGLPANDPRIAAFATDGRFLYANVADGTTAGVYIWKRDYNDAWHNFIWRSDLGIATTMLQAVGAIGATTVNAVVFAYKSGSNWQLAYARFPATIDPRKDSNYTFDTTGTSTLRTLDYVASYPTVPKFSDRLNSIADKQSSTRTVAYAAWLDEDTSSQSLGTFEKSPSDEQVLPSPVDYYRMSLEVTQTTEAATAPELRAFHLSAQFLPRVVRKHTYQFMSADHMPLRTGGRARTSWDDTINKIRALRKTRKSVPFTDEFGRKFTVYLDDVSEWTAEDKAAPDSNPIVIATVVLKEIVT